MTCNDCAYYYKDLGDEIACCHFDVDEWLDNTAPCERDDIEEEN